MCHPPVHDTLPRCQVDVPLLEVTVGGVVSLNHLVQRNGQLLPAVLCLPTQLLDGRVDMHGVLRCRIYVDHLLCRSLLQSVDLLL